MPLVSDYLALWCLFPSIVVSLALNAAQDGTNLLTPVRPSVPLSISNMSTTITNSTSLGDDGPSIHCDDALYGHPPVASCRDTVNYLRHDAGSLLSPAQSFGPRGEGIHWDVPLPFRVISSDGKCIIDYTQTSSPSHVRPADIFAAGQITQAQCVETGPPPFGGQATNLGLERNFVMTLRSYVPPFIKCRESPPAQQPVTEACATILSTMQATEERVVFGPASTSDVQEVLPRMLTEPTGKCTIYIANISGFSDRASWYDLWAAAVALDGMCARSGKTGQAYVLGAYRKLQMHIVRHL